jgi:putative hemolysin
MSGTQILYLVLLVVCIALSSFFSSSETAFISLQRYRVEHLVATEVKGARRVARLIERPEKLLSAILLGNTFVNTAAASLATVLAVSVWQKQGILIATVGITAVLLVFGEATPKTLGAHHAERVAIRFARPVEIIYWLLTPFVIVLSWIAFGITKIIGGTPLPLSLISDEEIRTMISVGHKEGTVEESEAKMLHRVFDFGDRPVREVMVPRPEVVAIERGSRIAEFLALYAKTPLSRFPVYQENMDNAVGILSIKDVLMALAKGTVNNESTIDDLIRPAYFTPVTKRISELFAEMQDKNYRMAVVVDEYGGTAGIVSLTGLVEEIVGPVGDELATVEKEYEVINEDTFHIDGSMRIEEVNAEMGLGLPEGDYETVAGFVLGLLGHVPKAGERLRYKGLRLEVTEAHGQRIERIQVTKEKQSASAV